MLNNLLSNSITVTVIFMWQHTFQFHDLEYIAFLPFYLTDIFANEFGGGGGWGCVILSETCHSGEKSNINMVIKASAGAGAEPDSHPLSPVPKMPALSGPLFHPWCLTQFLSWDR